jgi:putative ATPase
MDEFTSSKIFQSKKPILFIDEIHRFNKAQQDVFLSPIEKGEFILVPFVPMM